MKSRATQQMDNTSHLCYTREAELIMSGARERKQTSFLSVCFRESVMCNWSKYGNLSDNEGVLAAPFQIHIVSF